MYILEPIIAAIGLRCLNWPCFLFDLPFGGRQNRLYGPRPNHWNKERVVPWKGGARLSKRVKDADKS